MIAAFSDERTTVHRLAQTAASARSDVRSTRWALRLERTRVRHWRRLVRARIDLAVASAVLPDPLGQDAAGVLRELAGNGYAGHVVVEVKTRGLSRTERTNALAVSLNFARHHLATPVGQIR